MAHALSIKKYVEQRVRDGASADTIWREARAKFPHKIVGWNYISALRRDTIDVDIAAKRLAEIKEASK